MRSLAIASQPTDLASVMAFPATRLLIRMFHGGSSSSAVADASIGCRREITASSRNCTEQPMSTRLHHALVAKLDSRTQSLHTSLGAGLPGTGQARSPVLLLGLLGRAFHSSRPLSLVSSDNGSGGFRTGSPSLFPPESPGSNAGSPGRHVQDGDSFQFPRSPSPPTSSSSSSSSPPPSSPPPPPVLYHDHDLPMSSHFSQVMHSSMTILKTLQFNPRGEESLTETTKTDLTAQLRLQTRDLRALDLRKQQPTILPRANATIINMLHVKAIIRSNSALFFDFDHAEMEELRRCLHDRLKTSSLSLMFSDPLPFEFKVLEEILINVCASLSAKLSALRPSVLQVLADLAETDRAELDKPQLTALLNYSKRLTAFEREVNDVKVALTRLLDSDEDMASMYLTTKAQTGHARRIDQHEEVELLLENYLNEVEDVAAEVEQMIAHIRNTEDVITITLDSKRNTIMRMELQLAMGTFSVAVCGLVAASFGMNLQSSLEQSPHMFWIVSTIICMGSWAIWRVLAWTGRRRKIW